mgnify:FL=1
MNVAIFKAGQTPQYLISVNGAEYMVDPQALEGTVVSNDPDVLINPNISAVQNIDRKFWKRVGNSIVEMSASEKQTILNAELAQRKTQADNFGVGLLEFATALIKVINIRLPAGQKITKQEMIDALKAEIL